MGRFMSNFPVLSGVRDIFLSDGGNDDNDGNSQQYAVKTITRAIELAELVSPPPTLSNGASIVDLAYSRYTGDFTFPDSVQALMTGCAVIGTVKAGAAALLKFQLISTIGTGNQVAYSTDGKSRVGLRADALVTNGVSDTCISVDGASDEAFINVGQALVRASNSICLSVTAASNNLETFNIDVCDMGDATSNPANCVGVKINATVLTPIVFRGGKIKSNSTATDNIGIELLSGDVIVSGTAIEMYNDPISPQLSEIAIYVAAGTTLSINSAYISGNIFVEVGGTLDASITHHYGILVAQGDVNGWIDNVRYRASVEGSDLSNSFAKEGAIQNQESDFGHLSFDTTTDTTTGIHCSYVQTTTASRTVNVSIVDANDPVTVYWLYSNVSTTEGYNRFDIDLVADLVTPIPSNQQIDLIFTVNKSGGQGEYDFNLQYERVRA